MIYLVAAMSCVVIVTIVLWAYARYARLDMDRLAALEEWSNDYFDCATKLAMIDKAPKQLLDDIMALSRSLDDSQAPLKLLSCLEATQTHRIKDDPNTTELFDFLRREQLVDIYLEMAKSYIYTISYKDRTSGPKIRKLLALAEGRDSEKAKSSTPRVFDDVLNSLENWRTAFIVRCLHRPAY
jgi:hypothetical protein